MIDIVLWSKLVKYHCLKQNTRVLKLSSLNITVWCAIYFMCGNWVWLSAQFFWTLENRVIEMDYIYRQCNCLSHSRCEACGWWGTIFVTVIALLNYIGTNHSRSLKKSNWVMSETLVMAITQTNTFRRSKTIVNTSAICCGSWRAKSWGFDGTFVRKKDKWSH